MKTSIIIMGLIAVFIVVSGIHLASGTNMNGSRTMNRASDPYNQSAELETAVFAGGCFWCVESDFEKIDGVAEVISGYTGGNVENPTYEQVGSGQTEHVEAVEVRYDPQKVSYEQLLNAFWKHIDPTDPGGQFVDRGRQYRSVIFYKNEEQKQQAQASKAALEESGRFNGPIATGIEPLQTFYPAEDYHQDYYRKNPIRYSTYRFLSGRDQFLEKAWKMVGTDNEPNEGRYVKPNRDTLKTRLSPLQYKVTQKNGTEPPFENEYWDNKKDGIYVDIVSGEPLFSSRDKYKSGTGWPSFIRPLEENNVVEKQDRSLFATRTEVRSKNGDSHLGHVFPDGPQPTGMRYCINSASLRFIPKANLEKEGYGQYLDLFK